MTSDNSRKGRILVVDDQVDMCWVLSRLLTVRGHEVRTAQSVSAALAEREGFECQVAVVDYRLPEGDGLGFIAEIRRRLPWICPILMTSYGDESLARSVAKANLFAYFDKPFDNNRMIRTVEEAIRHCWNHE